MFAITIAWRYYATMKFRANGWRSHEEREPQLAALEQRRDVQQYMQRQQGRLSHQVKWMLDHLMNQAVNSPALTRTDGRLDDFDLQRIAQPYRHKPGYMREARFHDGIWVQATTANALYDSVHNLFLYKGGRPHEYIQTAINEDSQVVGRDANTSGADEIATVPGIVHDLGKIQAVFEIEHAVKWPQALTPDELERVRKQTDE